MWTLNARCLRVEFKKKNLKASDEIGNVYFYTYTHVYIGAQD